MRGKAKVRGSWRILRKTINTVALVVPLGHRKVTLPLTSTGVCRDMVVAVAAVADSMIQPRYVVFCSFICLRPPRRFG